MDKQQLLSKWGEPQKVGTDGHIRLVDVMGGDDAIVQAARTSYGKGTKSITEDRGLIRYLMRHWHTTPFEMCEIKLHVRVPMDVWRQWIRHRTASVNEYSTRYSEAIDSQNTTTPEEWRLQSKNNKQGSSGFLIDQSTLDMKNMLAADLGIDKDVQWPGDVLASDFSNQEIMAFDKTKRLYNRLLEAGVAREQARKILPLSTYTEAYWKVDLHNLFHFLRLRLDSHAQQEIREFGEAIANIVRDWVPEAWAAFEEYRLGAVQFSATEMIAIRKLIRDPTTFDNGEKYDGWSPVSLLEVPDYERKDFLEACGLTTQRERIEFWNKIK